MFCDKCGNELKEGAKFCDKCGAKTGTSATRKSHKFVILAIIAIVVVIALVIIILVKKAGKDEPNFGETEPVASVDSETISDDTMSELPELAPDSEEEYEAFLDKLEYLTLGDEAGDDSKAATADLGDIEDNSEDMADSDENGAAIASALSTTDYAKAMDFEWLHDVMESDGTGAGVILDATQANPISADDNSYLSGGWKAYMYGTDSDYGERYMNAEIDEQDGKISITLNWKYFNLEGTSYEENGSSVFDGRRNTSDGVITAQSNDGNLELSEFYISKDKKHEYALGAFQYPSGELYILGLMR